MYRLFSLFFSIVFLLILFCSGCQDKTVPATLELSQPETELPTAPPLLADPFQPRPTIKELTLNESKTETTIPATPKSETVKPETPLSSDLPADDIFVQAAMNQNAVTVSGGFGAVTPNTLVSELPITNEITSVKPLEELKPAEEAQPTETANPAEKINETSVIPKEPEPVTMPYVSEPLVSSVPATTEPFVPNSVPVTPSPVNPLRQETQLPTTEVAQNQMESPTIDVAQNQMELPTRDVAQNQMELPTREVAQNQMEFPTREVAQNQTELPTRDVAQNQTELPTREVAQNQTELPTTDVVQNQTELSTIDVAQNQTESLTVEVTQNQTKSPTVKVAQNQTELPTVDVAPSEAKQPFDPVAINGELFVGWEKPKLLLVFTGFLNGYVEPCGCAGLEQMKGGLSRRYTFFKELEEKKGWSILPIDAGNLNKGFGRQEELKFNFVIDEALRLMKYQAAGIGNRELLLPTDALILYFVDVPGIPRRYTSANVAIMQFDPDFTAPYRVFEQNGVKVGVTSVIGQSLLKEVNNDDIKHEDAVKRLKEILPQFAAEKCDKRVLIVHGSAEETKRIVRSMTGQFDYVLPSDTPAEPPFRPNWMENSMLIEVGEKGKFAVAVG
ncbi:MAG: hypothetical protein LBC02_00245, partial [Planctomycetaceae bacterium]|nr:hypothetical protein [Planctomycetaceae bacterium]